MVSKMPPAIPEAEHTDDVIEYTLRVVLALAPSLNAAVVKQAEKAARDRFGGDQAYIGKRLNEGRMERDQAIRRDYQGGARAELLARRYGLSPLQIWRIVKKGD